MTPKQLIRFTNDAGGLEKILRLFQSFSQILAAYALTTENEKLWLHLRKQFALGRRYFRFFKFLDCFSKAWTCFYGSEGLEALLGTAKWSFMGLYLILESMTILDAIGIWPTPWAASCMFEANRFWFYSLVCSIFSGVLQLFMIRGVDERLEKSAKKANGETGPKSTSSRVIIEKGASSVGPKKLDGVKRRIVSDCFDLLIPGHATGWILTSTATVGFASVVSTTLSSKDIWDRLKE